MKLFIGCSSSDKIDKKYLDDCNGYLSLLLKDNDIVFGACSSGIMGLSYEIAKRNNNKVTGICPEVYKDDLLELECNCERLTKTISDRTDEMIRESDALIFLPGGIGTIYELFTAIESKRNKEFDKPIIIYNSNNYFDKLLLFLDYLYNQNFTDISVSGNYHISDSAEDTLNYIHNYYNHKKLVKNK